MKYSVSIMYTMHLGLLDKSRLSKLTYSLYCVHVLSQLSLISFFRITDRELPFEQILACDQLGAMPISVQMITWLVMQGLVHFVKSHVRWVHAPLRKYIRRDERYCHCTHWRSIYHGLVHCKTAVSPLQQIQKREWSQLKYSQWAKPTMYPLLGPPESITTMNLKIRSQQTNLLAPNLQASSSYLTRTIIDL